MRISSAERKESMKLYGWITKSKTSPFSFHVYKFISNLKSILKLVTLKNAELNEGGGGRNEPVVHSK